MEQLYLRSSPTKLVCVSVFSFSLSCCVYSQWQITIFFYAIFPSNKNMNIRTVWFFFWCIFGAQWKKTNNWISLSNASKCGKIDVNEKIWIYLAPMFVWFCSHWQNNCVYYRANFCVSSAITKNPFKCKQKMEMTRTVFAHFQLNFSTIIVLILVINLCGKWKQQIIYRNREKIERTVSTMRGPTREDKHVICVLMYVSACVCVRVCVSWKINWMPLIL